MKKFISSFLAIMCLVSLSYGESSIVNVSARQRYPWNGIVDISYEVTGDIAKEAKEKGLLTSLRISAVDRRTENTYTASAVSGDVSLVPGEHVVAWDMKADGLSFTSDSVAFDVCCDATEAKYCVVDLTGGTETDSYAVSYMDEIPGGSWSDEYKTTKLVLRRLNAGTFLMQGSSTTTLSKPLYMGVFEVTQKQWALVMGADPCSSTLYGKGDTHPVHFVSYGMIRGNVEGKRWPSSDSVDEISFVGVIQKKTGLGFDLPTEAQWEYACRSNTTGKYSYGEYANGDFMWYKVNSESVTHEVGTTAPNSWGLYDMHGNVMEWCLDWYGSLQYGDDPKGAKSNSDSERVRRGGYWDSLDVGCTSAFRSHSKYSSANSACGLRLALCIQ